VAHSKLRLAVRHHADIDFVNRKVGRDHRDDWGQPGPTCRIGHVLQQRAAIQLRELLG